MKNCEICGTVITPGSGRSKYCSEACARAAQLNQYRKYNMEADGKTPPRIHPMDYAEIVRNVGFLEGLATGVDDRIGVCITETCDDLMRILKPYGGVNNG